MKAKTMALACAAAVCGAAFADEESESTGWAYNPGEGVSFDEQPIMTAEFGLAFDSKYMTYGVIDGKDPIVTPSATATFFDLVYVGVEAIFDTTKQQGRKWGGYGNRAGKYTSRCDRRRCARLRPLRRTRCSLRGLQLHLRVYSAPRR